MLWHSIFLHLFVCILAFPSSQGQRQTSLGFRSSTYTVGEADGFVFVCLVVTKKDPFNTDPLNIAGTLTFRNGTATSGEDYSNEEKHFSIEYSLASWCPQIHIIQDNKYEGNETFTVALMLHNNSNVQITVGEATVTIIDDEVSLCENCHSKAICNLTSCICSDGYTGDGVKTCQDINECTVKNSCSKYSSCTNTEGSYHCNCLKGYTGNGLNCDDIDECNISPCNESFSICVNNLGSYQCVCQYGVAYLPKRNQMICKGACQEETTGESAAQGIFLWRATAGGNGTFVECPYGANNRSLPTEDDRSLQHNLETAHKASRSCQCNDDLCQSPNWLEPDTSQCKYRVKNESDVTEDLSTLYQDIQNGTISTVDASIRLVNLTDNSRNFEQDDVSLTVSILENIVEETNLLNKTGKNIIKSVDNFLNADPVIVFQSQRSDNSSARVLSVVEHYLENVDINADEEIEQNEQNIAVSTREVNQSEFQGAAAESENNYFSVYSNDFSVRPSSSKISLTMPKSIFETLNINSGKQSQRISFVVYRKASLFQSQAKETVGEKTVNKLNSWVISGSIKGRKLDNLEDPIVTTYKPLEGGIRENTACVFWDFSLKDRIGDWSQAGCAYQGTKYGIVTCNCSHLTNFAILIDVNINDRIDEDHQKALSIISYIGCAISLGGLFLTIITNLLFKDLRTRTPIKILLNFCIALTLTLIVFIVAAERSKTSSVIWCRVAAIALHYFVLAVFMWMAIEAYNMYRCFVKILLAPDDSSFMIKCFIVGWGIPAIIVIVTAVLKIEEYGDENYCRLQGFPFQVAFLAPVLLILLTNFIAFVLILRSLLTSGKNVTADRTISGITQARRAISILVVLGLTWVFGVLAIKEARLGVQYLFCIFNAFQGLLVFFFHCILSKDIRKKWMSLCSRKEGTCTSTGHHDLGTHSRFNEIAANKSRVINSDTGSTSLSSDRNYVVSMEMK
ncbi:adhesion G protein-coupled receptor L4-like [Dendronephthya gigantea]|uniref:adhesion G protein-coupled receptor L4-like n=1 Tax=Dendronephthya gigantea TaxID=151771 RepID=UPI00106BE379|nr:adhesion G protein-coupled receptor L4-like [Dendronephthya gigantea]